VSSLRRSTSHAPVASVNGSASGRKALQLSASASASSAAVVAEVCAAAEDAEDRAERAQLEAAALRERLAHQEEREQATYDQVEAQLVHLRAEQVRHLLSLTTSNELHHIK
jgi:hypothetical protein